MNVESDVPLFDTNVVISARSLNFDAVHSPVVAWIVVDDVQAVVMNACGPSERLIVGLCMVAPKFKPEIVTEVAALLMKL